MGYSYLGAVSSPVLEMQNTLKSLGYLKASDVDGIYGKTTMTAVVKLGLDSVTDFASSINRGGMDGRPLVDEAATRDFANRAMKGINTQLGSTLISGRFSGTSAAFDDVKRAQARLLEAWQKWIKANGNPPSDRAAKFLAMNISKSGGGGTRTSSAPAPAPSASVPPPAVAPEAPSLPSAGLSPMVIVGVGVGLAALLLVWGMSKGKKPATAGA